MTNFGKLVVGFLIAGATIIFSWFIFTNFIIESDIVQREREGEIETYVYETEVDGPEECSSYEKYDAEAGICYFECETENQCKQIEQDIDNELASWTEELEKDTKPVSEKTISENDESLKADYSVGVGEKISFVRGADAQEYRKIWQDIAELAPDNVTNKYVEEYQVFDNASDDTLAFVDDEDGNGKWRIAINLAGHKSSNTKEQKATIIHELFHIISLNSEQIDSQISNCKTFSIDEGCANENSYLYLFKQKFWPNTSTQEFDENKFVTEYAATNEVEDLAESFSFFILENNVSGSLEKDNKLKFFYNFPELAQIRLDMRSVLAKDIIRARMSNN